MLLLDTHPGRYRSGFVVNRNLETKADSGYNGTVGYNMSF